LIFRNQPGKVSGQRILGDWLSELAWTAPPRSRRRRGGKYRPQGRCLRSGAT